MHAPIYILGGSQTDFARNWAREDLEIYDLFAAALQDAVQHAAIEPAQIDVATWVTSWATCLRVKA